MKLKHANEFDVNNLKNGEVIVTVKKTLFQKMKSIKI